MIKRLFQLGIAAIAIIAVIIYGPQLVSGLAGLGEHLSESVEGKSWETIADEFKEWRKDAKEKVDGLIEQTTTTLTPQNSPEETSDLVPVTLGHVVDGDTIWVINGKDEIKVRLIGINAEESVHSDSSKNNEYGTAASNHLKEMLEPNAPLWLEYDESNKDIYGRELCYVWLTDDTSDILEMVNAKMLADGYVYTATYKPNTRYEAVFAEIQAEAEANDTGLWTIDEFENKAKENE